MHLKLVPSTLEDLASYVVIGNSAFERDGLRLLMFPPERFDPRDPYAESRFRVIRTLKRAKDPQVRHLHVVDVDAEEDVSSLGDFTKEITEKIGQFEGEFGGVVEGFGEDHGKDKEVVGQEGKRKNGRARLVGESVWIAPAAVDEREQKDAEGPAEKGEMVGGVEKPKDDDSHLPNSLSKEVLEEVKEKLEIERKRVMGDRKDYWYLASLGTHEDYQGKGAASMMLEWGIDQAARAGKDIYVEATPSGGPVYRKHGFVPKGGFVMNNSDYVIVSMLKEPERHSAQ